MTRRRRRQVGTLMVESAKKTDSGNYTCSPSNSPTSTVTLHVINGEHLPFVTDAEPTEQRLFTMTGSRVFPIRGNQSFGIQKIHFWDLIH